MTAWLQGESDRRQQSSWAGSQWLPVKLEARSGAGVQGEPGGGAASHRAQGNADSWMWGRRGPRWGGNAGRPGTPAARCRKCGEGDRCGGKVVFGVSHPTHEEVVGDAGLELVKGGKGSLQPPKNRGSKWTGERWYIFSTCLCMMFHRFRTLAQSLPGPFTWCPHIQNEGSCGLIFSVPSRSNLLSSFPTVGHHFSINTESASCSVDWHRVGRRNSVPRSATDSWHLHITYSVLHMVFLATHVP